MFNQYKKKPKKPYTGPPRPTLLGHEKEFKGFREVVAELQHITVRQSDEIYRLRSKLMRLEQTVLQLSVAASKKR